MRPWIADYRVLRPLEDPLSPGLRVVAQPPARLDLPEDEVVVEIAPGDLDATTAAMRRWAWAVAVAGDAVWEPTSARGLAVPLEVGTAPLDDGSTGGVWVARRGVLAGDAGAAAEHPARVAGGAAAGLAALHSVGVVHGALGPGRLLAGTGGGILDTPAPLPAPVAGRRLRVSVVAALDTVAPEVARGEQPTAASDVWSLGASLLWLLTGRRLHPGIEQDVLLTALQRVVFEDPALGDVADGAGRLAAACLDPDPGARPSAAEVAAGLSSAAGTR